MTHPTLAPAKAPTNPSLRITVDGWPCIVTFDALTALDAADYRKATGSSLRAAIEAISVNGGVDLDQLAGLVWLTRRATEQELTFADVAGAIDYETPVLLEVIPPGD